MKVLLQITCRAPPSWHSCTWGQPATEKHDDGAEEGSDDATDHVVAGEVIAVVVERVENCRKCEKNAKRQHDNENHQPSITHVII